MAETSLLTSLAIGILFLNGALFIFDGWMSLKYDKMLNIPLNVGILILGIICVIVAGLMSMDLVVSVSKLIG